MSKLYLEVKQLSKNSICVKTNFKTNLPTKPKVGQTEHLHSHYMEVLV